MNDSIVCKDCYTYEIILVLVVVVDDGDYLVVIVTVDVLDLLDLLMNGYLLNMSLITVYNSVIYSGMSTLFNVYYYFYLP